MSTPSNVIDPFEEGTRPDAARGTSLRTVRTEHGDDASAERRC
jgi:hypothetical protein